MRRRLLLGGSFLALAAPARAAIPMLVTPEELQRDQASAQRSFSNRSIPPAAPEPGADAPQIIVDVPNASQTLHAPLSFRVRFVPQPGSAIEVHSFKAAYGFLGLDITDRLLEHARLTAQGLSADEVNIPAGNHKVTLTVADSMGREGSRTFRFTVG